MNTPRTFLLEILAPLITPNSFAHAISCPIVVLANPEFSAVKLQNFDEFGAALSTECVGAFRDGWHLELYDHAGFAFLPADHASLARYDARLSND